MEIIQLLAGCASILRVIAYTNALDITKRADPRRAELRVMLGLNPVTQGQGITRPKPPFVGWSLQCVSLRFGYVWFAHPAVLVTQTTIEHGTPDWATYVHDRIDQVLEHAAQEIEEHGGLLFIHDFRSMTSYVKEARLEFLRRMRLRQPGYSRGTLVSIRTDQPLLRMGIQAANLLMAVAVKAPLSIVDDPREAVESSVKAAPAADEIFPGDAARTPL